MAWDAMRQARMEPYMKLRDLARKTRIKVLRLSRLERGIEMPHPSEHKVISEALGVDLKPAVCLDEEAIAREERMVQILDLVYKIKQKHGKGSVGAVECPVCGGVVGFSIAEGSGHIFLRCSTVDCIGLIE